jgi:hypothetical protein
VVNGTDTEVDKLFALASLTTFIPVHDRPKYTDESTKTKSLSTYLAAQRETVTQTALIDRHSLTTYAVHYDSQIKSPNSNGR